MVVVVVMIDFLFNKPGGVALFLLLIQILLKNKKIKYKLKLVYVILCTSINQHVHDSTNK